MPEAKAFYKNAHISLNVNNGPILKIQNLAYSALRPLSENHYRDVACDVLQAMMSRTRDVIHILRDDV